MFRPYPIFMAVSLSWGYTVFGPVAAKNDG